MKTDLRTVLAMMACYAALMIGAAGIWYLPLTASMRLNMVVLLLWLTGTIAILIPILAKKP